METTEASVSSVEQIDSLNTRLTDIMSTAFKKASCAEGTSRRKSSTMVGKWARNPVASSTGRVQAGLPHQRLCRQIQNQRNNSLCKAKTHGESSVKKWIKCLKRQGYSEYVRDFLYFLASINWEVIVGLKLIMWSWDMMMNKYIFTLGAVVLISADSKVIFEWNMDKCLAHSKLHWIKCANYCGTSYMIHFIQICLLLYFALNGILVWFSPSACPRIRVWFSPPAIPPFHRLGLSSNHPAIPPSRRLGQPIFNLNLV